MLKGLKKSFFYIKRKKGLFLSFLSCTYLAKIALRTQGSALPFPLVFRLFFAGKKVDEALSQRRKQYEIQYRKHLYDTRYSTRN